MDKKVLIVGVGALGSHTAQFLRSLEGTNLSTMDGDRIESKNLLSQFHMKLAMGRNKAEGLKLLLQTVWGGRIKAIPHRLTIDNVRECFAGQDLVIDCVDNYASRTLIQNSARAFDIACLHGAISADGAVSRAAWNEYFVPDREPEAGAPTCENGAMLPAIALCSAFLARAAEIFLLDGKKIGYEINPRGAFSV